MTPLAGLGKPFAPLVTNLGHVWYTGPMNTRLLALIFVSAACGRDPVEMVPCVYGKQGLYAPCDSSDDCAEERVCFYGQCSPPCDLDGNCEPVEWEGVSVEGKCFYDPGGSACSFSCKGDGDETCPSPTGFPAICILYEDADVLGPATYACGAEQVCK